jgi:hypothetical protein
MFGYHPFAMTEFAAPQSSISFRRRKSGSLSKKRRLDEDEGGIGLGRTSKDSSGRSESIGASSGALSISLLGQFSVNAEGSFRSGGTCDGQIRDITPWVDIRTPF